MPAGADIARSEPAPGVVVLAVSGDVDLGSGSRLSREIAGAREDGAGVVVDLSETTFLDSSGLSALIRAAKDAHERGLFAVVCPEEGLVRRVFRLTRAYDLVDVHPTRAQALEVVHPEARRG